MWDAEKVLPTCALTETWMAKLTSILLPCPSTCEATLKTVCVLFSDFSGIVLLKFY
jgi:hypothetical protein